MGLRPAWATGEFQDSQDLLFLSTPGPLRTHTTCDVWTAFSFLDLVNFCNPEYLNQLLSL